MRQFYSRRKDGTYALSPLHEDMGEERALRDFEPTADDLIRPHEATITLADGQHVQAMVDEAGYLAVVDLP